MTIYTATFRTAHSWATHDIESDAPEQALEQAQALAEADDGTLDWCAYDPASTPLEEIEVEDPADGSVVWVWQSDELRLRLAAQDLYDALEELVAREQAAALENGFIEDQMSWLEDAKRALTKAKSET
jgi:hypothetical protein